VYFVELLETLWKLKQFELAVEASISFLNPVKYAFRSTLSRSSHNFQTCIFPCFKSPHYTMTPNPTLFFSPEEEVDQGVRAARDQLISPPSRKPPKSHRIELMVSKTRASNNRHKKRAITEKGL
jgi:hypothetical protein